MCIDGDFMQAWMGSLAGAGPLAQSVNVDIPDGFAGFVCMRES